jgi:Dolichyl-phosphate-mannose-protein mannosyltransferase
MSKARFWPWLVVPVLAAIAFAPVLGLWFVADDFGHLLFNERLPFPTALSAFDGNNFFYRPLSTILTWNIGTTLLGTNALPYHIVSLALHALSAFLVARFAYVVSNSATTGWVAGALFAVYPLTIEPVAWLASQWDLLGTSCVLGAAWAFAVAWKKGDWRPYVLGFVLASLAVGMKESTLPLPAVLPFVALAIGRQRSTGKGEDAPRGSLFARLVGDIRNRSSFVAMIAWALPYAVPTVVFAGVRLLGGGKIGGYTNAATDFQHFFWDALVVALKTLLMPLNGQVFDKTLTQIMGLLMSIMVLGALFWWGKQRRRILLLALAWGLIFLIPALNLVATGNNTANMTNRIYYLVMVGFCLGLGSVLSVPLEEWPAREGRWAWGVVVVVLLLFIPITWKQLEPWTQASRQTKHIVEEIDAMLPLANNNWIDIYSHDTPLNYKGAYVFLNGLESAIQVFHKQHVHLSQVDSLSSAELVKPLHNVAGRWNLDFGFKGDSKLFEIDGLSGFTQDSKALKVAPSGKLLDFSECAQTLATPGGAVIDLTNWRCDQGLTPVAGGDGELDLSGLNIDLVGADWVRLAVSSSYPAAGADSVGEWFWSSEAAGFADEREAHFQLFRSTEQYVYWTYVPAQKIGATLDGLRFKVTNGGESLRIKWVGVTPVVVEAK